MNRDDLTLMYFPDLDVESGNLSGLTLVPLQIRNFRLCIPPRRDIEWIQGTLDRQCQRFGTRVMMEPDSRLAVVASLSS
jgi:poly-gamma-glutamate synthesis protein (capsule biosynthesis protein)